MQRALVVGSSGGIGSALVVALDARGYAVSGLSRSADGIDVTDEASVAAHLGALKGPFQRIIIAVGVLESGGQRPEKSLQEVNAQGLSALFLGNAVGPALVIKHAVRLLPRGEPAVLAALSARVGSIGDNRAGGWYGYRTSKAALNMIIRTAAIELARTHRQTVCVALHPGTVATRFTERYLGRHPAVPPAEAAANLLEVIDGLTPAASGQFFDWAGKPVAW